MNIYVFVTPEQFELLEICSELDAACGVDPSVFKQLVDMDRVPQNRVYSESYREGYFDYWITTGPPPTITTTLEGPPYSLLSGERFSPGALPFTLQQKARGGGEIKVEIEVKKGEKI